MSAQPPYYPQPMQSQTPPQKSGMSWVTCLIIAIVAIPVSIAMIGVIAALAIYGVRRNLATSKGAEAKNTIGAITRSAVAAYERESFAETGSGFTHKLCTSAIPVPAAGPPAAKKYMPSTAAGQDYDTGSTSAGWKCLKFSMSDPQYYQYHYHAGSGYLTTRWSVAPGPDGFEAAAQGDLDGNGVASTFARTATVRNGTVVVSTEMFIDREFE